MHVMSARSRGIFLWTLDLRAVCCLDFGLEHWDRGMEGRKRGVFEKKSHTSLSCTAAFTSRATLRAGPHGAAYLRDVSIPSSTFGSCSFVAFGSPFPLGPRACCCRARLDEYGHHRAACATSGVLSRSRRARHRTGLPRSRSPRWSQRCSVGHEP